MAEHRLPSVHQILHDVIGGRNCASDHQLIVEARTPVPEQTDKDKNIPVKHFFRCCLIITDFFIVSQYG